MKTRVGIVDLGTNTFHVLVAEMEGMEYSFIHKEKIHVALGQGGINTGVITPESANRAFSAALHIKNLLDLYKVERTKCVATSALRSSGNSSEIIDQLTGITGMDIEIISGEKEAAYIFEGVSLALKMDESDGLIMDIGGGSVEFVIGNSSGIKWKKSLEIGAQRLTDKFHENDPILPGEIRNVEQYLIEKLTPLYQALNVYKPKILIGSSGTFDTLSEIYRRKNDIAIVPDQTELPLSIEGMKDIQLEIISKNRAQRLQISGMIEMRVDLIVVASILIQSVIMMNSFEGVRVSSYSLKEGIFSEFLKSQKYLV
jgi:exopolyphosphatase/guanosine-5'-triphosphate,3'-diphosphate pyrophosphatase